MREENHTNIQAVDCVRETTPSHAKFGEESSHWDFCGASEI